MKTQRNNTIKNEANNHTNQTSNRKIIPSIERPTKQLMKHPPLNHAANQTTNQNRMENK
jgi:hypothetical protein